MNMQERKLLTADSLFGKQHSPARLPKAGQTPNTGDYHRRNPS